MHQTIRTEAQRHGTEPLRRVPVHQRAPGHASIGTEIEVLWGNCGNRIKSVRATVERYPYLTEGRSDQVMTV